MKEKISEMFKNKIKLCQYKFSNEELIEIELLTDFLHDASFTERCYNILNDLTEEVKCFECGENKPTFLRISSGYRTFCSAECKNKYIFRETDVAKLISKSSKAAYYSFSEAERKEQQKKRRKTMENSGKLIPLEMVPDREKYYLQVLKYTKNQPISTLKNFELRGRAEVEGAFQLDHRFSICEGFRQNVAPWIIGSIYNLEMIPAKENVAKNYRCSISLDELVNQFYSDRDVVKLFW